MRSTSWTKMLFAVILVFSLVVLIGCGSPSATTTAPAPAPAPAAPAPAPATPAPAPVAPAPAAPAPAPAPPASVMKLKLSSPYFEPQAPSVYAAHFADLIEKKSNGKIKIERFYGGTLGTLLEHGQLLSSGSVDIISLHLGTLGQQYPLNDAQPSNLALSREKTQALINAYRQTPEVKAIIEAEQKKNNIKVFDYNMAGTSVVLSKSPANSLKDLSGKKVNLISQTAKGAWEAMGWLPVNIQYPDVYDGLSRGIVDAGFGAITAARDLKWQEITKTCFNLNTWTSEIPVAFNWTKFYSLPADIQQNIIDAAHETAEWSVQYDVGSTDDSFKKFEAAGCHVVTATAEETKKFSEASISLKVSAWLANCDKAGVTDQAKVLQKIWNDMYAAALAGK
jgi:TRAP-type C4-dicarboxylate transport system substrate-binding protein